MGRFLGWGGGFAHHFLSILIFFLHLFIFKRQRETEHKWGRGRENITYFLMLQDHLCISYPVLKSAIPQGPLVPCIGECLRNKDLGTGCAHCYWGVSFKVLSADRVRKSMCAY